jgi:hypothetical protein
MANYITEFIPEIWSAKILDDKKKIHVFGGLANRDYEGEIKQKGDKVRIPQVGHPTVQSYTRNNFGTGLTKEYANVSAMDLTVDQEKYINVLFDDIDVAQSSVNFIPKLQENSAYQLAQTQDTYIAGLYGQAGLSSTSNGSTSYVTIGSSNVKTELLLMGKTFTVNNIPMDRRWLSIPPALEFELIDAGILEQSNNDQLWVDGTLMGRKAYGWNIIVSNNLSSPSTDTDQYRILCGYANESISMAEQITKMKMGELDQEGFGSYLKMLHVYGARLIPDRTGVIYAKVTNS